MNEAPQISIHLTTFRRYRNGMLQNAIDSILTQTFRNFELIVCDDASYDGTSQYLDDLGKSEPRLKVVRNDKNFNNVAISLGRCMLSANPSTSIITWMFDDCVLHANALKILFEEFCRTKADVVFGVTKVSLSSGGAMMVGGHDVPFIRANIARNSTLVPNAGILIRREVFDQTGWYDSNIIMRRSCDWELFIRIFSQCKNIKKIDDIVCDEFGDQQLDSLRNSFFTSLDLMSSYVRRRDSSGFRLDLQAIVDQPVDLLPSGDWSPDEMKHIYFMFVEYFLSVGEFDKAADWADKLEARAEPMPFFVENMENISLSNEDRRSTQARAAIAAMKFYHFKPELSMQRASNLRSSILMKAMYENLVAVEVENSELVRRKLELSNRDVDQRALTSALLGIAGSLPIGNGAGWIDRVTPVSEDDQVVVGWGTADIDGDPRKMRVLVTFQDEVIGRAELAFDRSDILISHPHARSIRLGFEVNVPRAIAPEGIRVLIFDSENFHFLSNA